MFKYLNKGISTPIAISIIVLIAVIVGGGILAYQYWWLPKEEVKNVACTMEAKLCPDGSYVGRIGPNCEFAQCPDVKKDETADWETYINEKYDYSFKYPPECYLGALPGWCKKMSSEERPSECLCRLNETDKDYILLQGDVSEKGWPNIEIEHYDTSFYNPPVGTDLITWLKEKSAYRDDIPNETNFEISGIPAVKVHTPGVISDQPETFGQAYSMNVIYCLKANKLFSIRMLDVDSRGGREFYDLFLPTFKFIE